MRNIPSGISKLGGGLISIISSGSDKVSTAVQYILSPGEQVSLELHKKVKTPLYLWFTLSILRGIVAYGGFKSVEHITEIPGGTSYKFVQAMSYPVNKVQEIMGMNMQEEISKYHRASEQLDGLTIDPEDLAKIKKVNILMAEIEEQGLSMDNISRLASLVPDLPDIGKNLEAMSNNIEQIKTLVDTEVETLRNMKGNYDNKRLETIKAALYTALVYLLILKLLELIKLKNRDSLTTIARKRTYEGMKKNNFLWLFNGGDTVLEDISEDELATMLEESMTGVDLSDPDLDTTVVFQQQAEYLMGRLDS